MLLNNPRFLYRSCPRHPQLPKAAFNALVADEIRVDDPRDLTEETTAQTGLNAHRGLDEQASSIRPGVLTPDTPSPAGFFPPLLGERVAVEWIDILHRRSPDFALKALRITAAPATPMLHFHAGWVSSHMRGLLGSACSPKSPSARSCPSTGAKSPSGSALDFGSSVIWEPKPPRTIMASIRRGERRWVMSIPLPAPPATISLGAFSAL